jgi:thiol-disulfide isomerase/thioredoxin
MTFIMLALCGFGLAGYARQPAGVFPSEDNKLLAVGKLAPDWKLSDAAGRTHSLSDYRGQVVVLDFWATWCGPCAALMPRMQQLHDKFRDRGAVVFGVNAWETGDAPALMKEKRFTYGLLLRGEEIAPAYGIINLPVVYVIGTDGVIIYRNEGIDDKDLGKLIEKYLKERASKGTRKSRPEIRNPSAANLKSTGLKFQISNLPSII